ncbi:MAG: Calx-beta domain-containing protein, partial [Planctomycetota bacterium]
IHSASGEEQVLTLDWSVIAGLGIGDTESYIIPVAEWAGSALTSYGFGGGLLNLVGHSFGAYVATEMAERITGGVNTIVGLDPAADWFLDGRYNPNTAGEVDFAEYSQFAWTFSDAGGWMGSAITPGSADEAIAVKDTDHSPVVSLFANMLNGVGNADVLQYFPLSRLQTYAPGPWMPDQYNHSGNPSSSGTFEAVITATSSGTYASSIDFVSQSDTTSPTVAVSAPNGGEDWAAGSVHNITWTASDNVGVTSVDLYYSNNGPGGTFNPIASGETNDGFYQWTIPNDPTANAFVKVVAHDAASNTGEDLSNVAFTISGAPSYLDGVANADIPVKGTVNGTYLDTHASDNAYEAVTERLSGGKPQNRYSYLEHKWTIDVTRGAAVTFYLEAYRDSNSEGDDFVFAYSTDDVNYLPIATVTETSDDDVYQTFDLPGSLSGTVFVRLTDTDQTPSNNSPDTIYVDHMFIRSSGEPVDVHDVAVTGVNASPDPVVRGGTVTAAVDVANHGNFVEIFDVTVDVTVSAPPGTVTLDPQTVTLAPGATDTLNFSWVTDASTSLGEHTITATAATVPGESDPADNSATTTVTVDVAAPTTYSINNVSKRERRTGKTSTFTFTVTRSGATLGPISVYYKTDDDPPPTGASAAGGDYQAADGWLVFAEGETAKTFGVSVYGDLEPEPHETFSVLVRVSDDPTSEVLATGVGTITNDDKSSPRAATRATDAALAAWVEFESSDNEDTDDPATEAATELALLMMG